MNDGQLATVCREARLSFIYLLTIADDQGYFRADMKYLVGALFPKDEDVTEEVLREWLRALKRIGRIEVVQTPDGYIGHIVNWSKHQLLSQRHE